MVWPGTGVGYQDLLQRVGKTLSAKPAVEWLDYSAKLKGAIPFCNDFLLCSNATEGLTILSDDIQSSEEAGDVMLLLLRYLPRFLGRSGQRLFVFIDKTLKRTQQGPMASSRHSAGANSSAPQPEHSRQMEDLYPIFEGHPPAVIARLPPSMGMSAPVTHSDASEARKMATPLMSFGRPSLPVGMPLRN